MQRAPTGLSNMRRRLQYPKAYLYLADHANKVLSAGE